MEIGFDGFNLSINDEILKNSIFRQPTVIRNILLLLMLDRRKWLTTWGAHTRRGCDYAKCSFGFNNCNHDALHQRTVVLNFVPHSW